MGLVSGVCPQEVLAISVGRSSVTGVCRPGELLSGTEEQIPGMSDDQRGRACHRAEAGKLVGGTGHLVPIDLYSLNYRFF